MKYQILNLKQGTPEWKAERLKRCTASQIPILFDLSPYQTILELFEEKSMEIEMPISESKQILFNRGHEAEDVGREWVKTNLGLDLQPHVVLSLEVPDLLASLDGFDEEKKIIFEAKYMGAQKLLDVKKGIIPAHHECQVQAQLLATGASKCVYFAMDGTNAAMLEVFPKLEYQKDISLAVAKFMEQVRTGQEPEPSERDYITPDDVQFEILRQKKEMMDEAKKQFEELKESLLAKYVENRRIKAGGLRITRSMKKGNVIYKNIPQLKGVDLDRYRGKSSEVLTVAYDSELKAKKSDRSSA